MKKHQIFLLLLAAAHAQAAAGSDALPDSGKHVDGSSQKNEATAGKQEEDKLDSDGHVFGYRNGYLHAALGATGEWTDNLYNHRDDKQDNFLTRITPSVWVTWPRRYRRPLQIASDNTAVGGMQYSQADYDVFNKYQLYLAGRMDLMTYSANSDLDHAESSFDGSFLYQPTSRITLQLLDQYTPRSQDQFSIAEATAENNRVYASNIFGANARWAFSEKFEFSAGYNNFVLLYEEDVNDFMNRADHGFNLGASYDYSPKTSFFAEYQYFLAAYDEEKTLDNSNTYLNGGINWQATVKTSLMVKAGYQQVDYDYEEDRLDNVAGLADDAEAGLNFETQGIWQATQRSNLLLNARYHIEQTDSERALNKAVFAARAAFDYRFTNRLRGDINFIYENSDYDQYEGASRVDDRWYLKPELQYALTKWLFLNVYCSFDKKDSSFDELDYETKTVGIGLRGSM